MSTSSEKGPATSEPGSSPRRSMSRTLADPSYSKRARHFLECLAWRFGEARSAAASRPRLTRPSPGLGAARTTSCKNPAKTALGLLLEDVFVLRVAKRKGPLVLGLANDESDGDSARVQRDQ